MEQSQQPKWKGRVTAKLTKAKPDQIWPFFTDFFNLHKWLPTLPTCYGIHGINGEPGCIRYCSGSSIPSSTATDDMSISWSKERLVAVDHVDRSLRYEMLDSNIGFKSYVSTVKIIPEEANVSGCVIQWSFEVDHVEGWVLEDMVNKYEVALRLTAKRMEDRLQEETEPKWEGKTTVEVKGLTADQTWPFVADFCNIDKLFPFVDKCYHVEGELGKPGLIRYCATAPRPSFDGTGEIKVDWAKEKILIIDPIERLLSYEITESNMGFKSYVATFKVLPVDGDGQRRCRIDWSFVADPIQGWSLEDFSSYLNTSLQYMAKKIEETVPSADV
ncbi:hypothetical protein JCGZ_07737 [Jatropha curcas]|uniref:Bet v I/Major latex protein domain-containing protein n=1 Tax=Jatropha curcas TaxID=180498 RepID=A0A067KD66_JATCU|nr:hypothetical protein JCGZ_07737 [Jatropha curcas]